MCHSQLQPPRPAGGRSKSVGVFSVAERVPARRTDKYDENNNIITIILRDFGVAAACNRAVADDVRISPAYDALSSFIAIEQFDIGSACAYHFNVL